MAATTVDRPIQMIGTPKSFEFNVAASTTILKGELVALDSAENLVSGTEAASLEVVGIAAEHVDNSAGAAGDKTCQVYADAQFQLAATSIAQTAVGELMHLVDNQTIDETAGTNTVKVGFLVRVISSTSGWVFIPPFPARIA